MSDRAAERAPNAARATWFYGDHSSTVWAGPPVRPMKFIVTTLERRGAGKDGDPVRKVAQFWSESGEFVLEFDPCAETPMLWSADFFGQAMEQNREAVADG